MNSSHKSNSKLARAYRRCAHMLRFVLGEDRGSALIELSLVMPLFVLLTLGWVDFARMAYFSIEASNAARGGVAYATQGTAFASNTSGTQAAGTTMRQTRRTRRYWRSRQTPFANATIRELLQPSEQPPPLAQPPVIVSESQPRHQLCSSEYFSASEHHLCVPGGPIRINGAWSGNHEG